MCKPGAVTLSTGWGDIRIDVADDGVVGCTLPHLNEIPSTHFSVISAGDDAFSIYVRELLEGGNPTRPAIGQLQGTEFQKKVWAGLLAIPHGTTLSYASLAKKIGRPTAIRATASACGRNPVPLIIPCHRVVASDGGLGGFSGGLAWKRLLLGIEQSRRP